MSAEEPKESKFTDAEAGIAGFVFCGLPLIFVAVVAVEVMIKAVRWALS